ncbi:MAG: acetate--CoA ligase family protein [Nitrososphaerota archaeon]
MKEETDYLKYLFDPASIAVIGVSQNPSKIGSIIYHRLINNKNLGILKAEVYPVNPKISSLNGVKVYPTISKIQDDVDLAVIAVPAEGVPEVVREAGGKNVKVAIIISGGFAESGRKDLDEKLRKAIQEAGIRVVGPNTIGILDPYSGVDTFFLPRFKPLSNGKMAESLPEVQPGNVAVISQSGALSEIIMDCLKVSGIGIRSIVCVGNQVDLTVEDFLRYFSRDPLTKVIALYLEGVSDGRRFLNALIEASTEKPVVVLKAGKTEVAGRAAYTHTASMVGSIEVYRGAFKQARVIEVEDMEEMIDIVKAFSIMKPAKGNRLFILTNAGGLAVISSDLALRYGLTIPNIPEEVYRNLDELRMKKIIDPIVVLQNPLDLTAQGTSETFEKVFRVVAASGFFDLYLLMPSHQPPTVDDTVIDKLFKVCKEHDCVAVVCEHGESEWSKYIRERFDQLGIPAYPDVRRALRALSALATHRRPANRLFEKTLNVNKIAWLDDLEDGPLDLENAVKLLNHYDLSTPKTLKISSEDELEYVSRELSFPLVMKIYSRKITHKTDIGGVVVGLKTYDELRESYNRLRKKISEMGIEWEGVIIQEMVKGVELLLGSSHDPVFGPTITFGIGGVLTEVLRDFSVRIAPVTLDDALEMINELRTKKVLEGFRDLPPVNLTELAWTISKFSRITWENPSIKQLEINPLIASGNRFEAVDVRGLITRI